MEGHLLDRGLYEPLVMFFSLTNSPATFQTMMDDIFKDLISEGMVVVYLDDILIFTKTLEEHQKITRRVLELLEKHKLYPPSRQVQVQEDHNQVPQSDHLSQLHRDGPGQDRWCYRVAPSDKQEGSAVLPWSEFTNFY